MISETVTQYVFKGIQMVLPLMIALIISIFIRKHFSNLIKKHLVKEHKGKETEQKGQINCF